MLAIRRGSGGAGLGDRWAERGAGRAARWPGRPLPRAALQWRRTRRGLLLPSIAAELATELKERADREAIRVFGENLEQLLLQPPAGPRTVVGLDPGFRTGVKVAVVSATGAVVATDTLYLHQEDRFAAGVRGLVERHRPEFVAIGNGTASRETEGAVRGALRQMEKAPGAGSGTASAAAGPDTAASLPTVVLVNEAGARSIPRRTWTGGSSPNCDVLHPGGGVDCPAAPGSLATREERPRSIGWAIPARRPPAQPPRTGWTRRDPLR